MSASERALWRAVAKSTLPLPGRTIPADEPRLALRRADAVVQAPASAEQRRPPREPAQLADRGAEKRVRRGRIDIAASLDLHGYTEMQAHGALRAFLMQQQARGARAVIVVTGKGRGGEEGILKRRLPLWLNAPDLRANIAGYAEAHRRHGGAGAYYVFLKRAPE